jgi:hypothetical protein
MSRQWLQAVDALEAEPMDQSSAVGEDDGDLGLGKHRGEAAETRGSHRCAR